MVSSYGEEAIACGENNTIIRVQKLKFTTSSAIFYSCDLGKAHYYYNHQYLNHYYYPYL